MKYFAKLGLGNKVVGFTHIRDSDAPTEEKGIEYLNKLHGYPFWKGYVKDGSIKKHSATMGFTYDENRDAFIDKKPYASWVINESTCQWEAPVAYPADGSVDKRYAWNEETTNWDERT